jgi:uncharacterized protein (DUF362 family)
MRRHKAAIVRYERPWESVRRAVELSDGLHGLKAGARVFVKPNIVFWTTAVPFPKWGVITTSRVVEDVVTMLKERGIDEITIGEGTVTRKPGDTETPRHAFETLGYEALRRRYGVRYVNVFERPFQKVELGDGISLNFNRDILESDFVVNLPVLKTHAQTVVSLGIKNLKGTIDIRSRKRCHSAEPGRDLHEMIARLADKMPPIFTLIDGIFTNERGPSFDGRIHRSNVLVASPDLLSADLAGARLLGIDPSTVPHLVCAARRRNRPLDLSDVETAGERLEQLTTPHEHQFPYNREGTLPIPMEKMGIRGLSYRKYDLTMCTYCSGLNGVILAAIARAWRGEPWDDVEVLTGKVMAPTPGRKKTILIGRCIYQANKNHPDIQEMIAVKGCPPSPQAVVGALHQAGIEVDPAIFEHIDRAPGFFMKKYEGRPEFDEALFRIE